MCVKKVWTLKHKIHSLFARLSTLLTSCSCTEWWELGQYNDTQPQHQDNKAVALNKMELYSFKETEVAEKNLNYSVLGIKEMINFI